MKKRHTLSGVVKRALLYSAPFLLLSAAIILFLYWGCERFIEGNVYYRLMTMAPEAQNDSEPITLDETEMESLKENNKGDVYVVPPEFPPIFLGQQWATITIESAGVYEQPVLHGDYEENLWRGIGHLSNSRFPGQHGKVVLSGHVGIEQFFQRLETMSIGDRVVLDTIYGEYVYEVTDTVIFHQDDKSLLIPEEVDTGDRLICYTCYPFRTTSVRTERFAIICDLVSGKDWTIPESAGEEIAHE